jgi:hypothetical protein
MKIPKILLLCILLAMVVVPSVSAKSVNDNSGKPANKGATEDEYT